MLLRRWLISPNDIRLHYNVVGAAALAKNPTLKQQLWHEHAGMQLFFFFCIQYISLSSFYLD